MTKQIRKGYDVVRAPVVLIPVVRLRIRGFRLHIRLPEADITHKITDQAEYGRHQLQKHHRRGNQRDDAPFLFLGRAVLFTLPFRWSAPLFWARRFRAAGTTRRGRTDSRPRLPALAPQHRTPLGRRRQIDPSMLAFIKTPPLSPAFIIPERGGTRKIILPCCTKANEPGRDRSRSALPPPGRTAGWW